MPTSDELKAAVEVLRKCKPASKAHILANLGVTAPIVSREEQPDLTRAEIADYLDRAGWDPDKARELAAAERAVDFGDGLTSKHLKVLTDLIVSAPEAERASLQLRTVELVARWLLRKRQVVGPDGKMVVGVRSLEEATRIVAGWINDGFVRQELIVSAKAEALGSARAHDQAPSARSGRPPRLASGFVDLAGTLWLNAKRQNIGSRPDLNASSNTTHKELAAIASALDSRNYIPPAKYLEKRFADELRRYNSRNSNSEAGAIKTWSQLVSAADKDHLRGMRRLLSRCAEKLSSLGPRLSGK